MAVFSMGLRQMNILGINKGWTCSGKLLRNGGVAALVDGKIYAIAEERVTGEKYAPGYREALRCLLLSQPENLTFDEIAVSTCCEPEAQSLHGHDLAGDPRLRSVNHHSSHASLAFFSSGYDTALVAVIDGGGNVLDSTQDAAEHDWWKREREQHSYYLASRRNGLKLIDRDFSAPYSVGMGEMYRAFTYYLGWHSSTNSSKTMALAGHGKTLTKNSDLFELEYGHLTSHAQNNPSDPIGMVTEISRLLDVDFGEPRQPRGAILQIHKDVAAFVQEQCEKALIAKLRFLARQFNIQRLCLAGGFALNVVSNGSLLDYFPDGVYVPSAPGDDGQCLGNVYARLALSRKKSKAMTIAVKSSDVFLGLSDRIDSTAVANGLAECDCRTYIVFETSDFTDLVAQMLASGSVVCLYQDRAEYGPRALGARSILADPRRPDAVSRLNALKGREWFMPFAPAVLAEEMSEWFTPQTESPFMSFAIRATARALRELPAIVNADASARVQTLAVNDSSKLRAILERFAARTKIPVLLNTSFNLGGKPIVETVRHAVESFSQMPVNALAIGRFVVVKSLSPDISDLPLSATITNLDLEIYRSYGGPPVRIPESKPHSMIRKLQRVTNSVVFVRTELPLYGEYLTWLREGRKVTTIRLRKGAVEIPYKEDLPLFETHDFGPGDRSKPTEYVKISALRYHRFGELSETDAVRDGFKSYQDMRRALRKIYKNIADEDWVTVYDIKLI